MALALVVLLRIGAPLMILRYPLAGALLAVGADYVDLHIFQALDWSGLPVSSYQLADKMFDTYYLSLELWMALQWRNRLLRDTAILLFMWRIAGVGFFAWSGREESLFLAPNIFEYFYLYVAGMTRFRPQFRIRRLATLAWVLVLLAGPKFFNEYVLHVRKTSTAAFLREVVPSAPVQAAAPSRE